MANQENNQQQRTNFYDQANRVAGAFRTAKKLGKAVNKAKTIGTVVSGGAEAGGAIAAGGPVAIAIGAVFLLAIFLIIIIPAVSSGATTPESTAPQTAQEPAPGLSAQNTFTGFGVKFDSSFDSTTLAWAESALKSAQTVAPNFFNLLKNASGSQPVIVKKTGGIGHREGNTIFFREGGGPLKDRVFFSVVLIHELAHVIYSPDQTGKNLKENMEKAEQEGYLTAYAAGSTPDPNVICDINAQNTAYKTSEDFAESVSYFINQGAHEFSYDAAVCPARLSSQNPIYSGLFPQHLSFMKNLLGGDQ